MNHPQHTLLLLITAIAAQHSSSVAANPASQSETQAELHEVTVQGVRQRLDQAGLLKDSIEKTELISAEMILNKGAVNLTEAIDGSPGVRVSTECTMCGVKRVMMNGLKGEHTTVLIDGIPLHTMISGFYALDAVSTTGVETIEVARGAGASLIAPEAIGGTLNIVTKEAVDNELQVTLAGGNFNNRLLGIMGTAVSNDDATRLTAISQYDHRAQIDEDNNGVSESPLLSNSSHTVRLSQDLGLNDNLIIRYSQIASEVFGGPMLGSVTPSVGSTLAGFEGFDTASDSIFIDNDVRNTYTGKPWETAEWVASDREEASVSWLHQVNDTGVSTTVTGAYSAHEQDSFYEGFDYYVMDELSYADARLHYPATKNHLLVMGIDIRDERMRSKSLAGDDLANQPDSEFVNDSFDYVVKGLYLQDSWTASDNLELSLAARFDWAQADFVDPSKPGVEIDKKLVSPRADVRYNHSDAWTSRLSVGRGYRAPLSFFESDHGILGDKGFIVEVDDLERSLGATYTLSYDANDLLINATISSTKVDNLAALTTTSDGSLLMYQLDETAQVKSADLVVSKQFFGSLQANITLETFIYDDVFKSTYAIAPIEDRVSLDLDYDINGWDFIFGAYWIGARDLREYSYYGENKLGSGVYKNTDAKSYITLNGKVAYEISDMMSIYLNVTNWLNYTQVRNEDTSLSYKDGAYDVTYIWGPLRGREWSLGVQFVI